MNHFIDKVAYMPCINEIQVPICGIASEIVGDDGALVQPEVKSIIETTNNNNIILLNRLCRIIFIPPE